jgi:hypothetical protein
VVISREQRLLALEQMGCFCVTTRPERVWGLNMPVVVIAISAVTIGFVAGYWVRAAVAYHRQTEARRHRLI